MTPPPATRAPPHAERGEEALRPLMPLVALGHDRVLDRPPDLQCRIIPQQGELTGAIVFGALLVVEDRALAHDKVPVAEIRRHEHLQMVGIGQGERDPFAILRRVRIVVHHDHVEAALQAGDQLPGLGVAMDAAQHVAVRYGNVVLDELDRNAGGEVGVAIVGLDVVAAEVLEHRRRLDQQDQFELRRKDFHLRYSFAARFRAAPNTSGWSLLLPCRAALPSDRRSSSP